MKNRLHAWICAFVLVVAISQSSICRGNIVSDTRRTKRETSVTGASRPKGEASYAEEINLKREEKGDDGPEEDDAYRDKEKGRRAAGPPDDEFRPSNAEANAYERDDVSDYLDPSEESEEVDEEATERDGSEEAGEPVRSPRDTSGDLDRYTEQDDDYETKDIAKRGVLSGGPEDYEEIDNGPGVLPREDTAAVQGSADEGAGKREARTDARVKRDQAEMSEGGASKSSPDVDPAKLRESGKTPYSCQVSRVALPKSSNEDATGIKGGSKAALAKLRDSSGTRGRAGEAISSGEDELDAERRVEEEIQRKIDSLKDEIQRDVRVQERVRDIEDNNARFDELRDREHEDEGKGNFKGEKERQAVKRAVREIADAASSQAGEKRRSLGRTEQHEKRQPRANKIERSDVPKENESLKGRSVANRDKSCEQQLPSKALRKKRERVRQIFLVNNNDQHQAKKRRSRSYALPSDRTAVRPENELSMNPESNSYSHTNNGMLLVSLPVSDGDKNNEGEQQNTAEHSDSLVSLTGSSQELNPYLEKEYKEAFGGLQSEPGSALARFKRIKRC